MPQLRLDERLQLEAIATRLADISLGGRESRRAPLPITRRFPGELSYETALGSAWIGDSLRLLEFLPAKSVHAVITSPPFALATPKKYGNAREDQYLEWFLPFARQLKRVVKPAGSIVLELGGTWLPGRPVRSIYHYEVVRALVRELDLRLAQEFYWHNRAKMPGPAQWVTIERVRVKDAVTPIFWFSPSDRPYADNRHVLRPYSRGMIELFSRGYNAGPRPSGHVVGKNFGARNAGAIPPNLLQVANTQSSGDRYRTYCLRNGLPLHPARFPAAVPRFFTQLLTKPGDTILDPFAGSNVTGAVADELGRRWISIELDGEYVKGSLGRFDPELITYPSSSEPDVNLTA